MENGVVVEAGSREYFENLCEGRHPGTTHLMRFFAWSHLPKNLKVVSVFSGTLAAQMVTTLPDGPELSAGLRKLLEAKDCFVRAEVDRVDEGD